jgi:hypothetical protein
MGARDRLIAVAHVQFGSFMNRHFSRALRGWWLPMLLGALFALSAQAQWRITSIRRINPPAAGIDQIRVRPGDWVEIIGTGLSRVTQIRFNLAPATFSPGSTRLVAVVPAGATIGPMSLLDSLGEFYTTPFNFQVSPRITGIARTIPTPSSPADALRGAPGNSVLFTGENFVDASDPSFTSVVYFPSINGGYVLAPTEFVSMTTMQVRVPASAVSGSPAVVNPAGDVIASALFYLQPLVSGFEPARAKVGDTVTVRGSSLLGTTEVRFGAVSVVPDRVTPTNVTVTVPLLTQSVPLTVVSPGGSFLTPSSLLLLPRITSFTPVGGVPGAVATLEGDGLSGTTGVWFGDVAATRFTNISPARVTAEVPVGGLAGPITLTTANGTNVTSTPFFVSPTVTGFSPLTAKPGATIVIQGSNFTNVSRVRFSGGIDALFTVASSNRLSATVPLGAQTGPVRVMNPGGEGVSGSSFVVARLDPIILGFTPTFGAAGAVVRVTGDNLGTATQVRFNGLAVGVFTVESDTSILTAVPAGATSGKVSVVTSNGTALSQTDFLVGSTANLVVTGQALPLAPVVGDEVAVTMQVENRGPLNSAGAVLSVSFPGATLIQAEASQGTFDVFGTTVVFAPGSIDRNTSLVANLRLRVTSTATLTVTGQADSDTVDPNTNDNSVSLTVRPVRPTVAVARLIDGSVELRWPSTPAGLVVEDAPRVTGPWRATAGTTENTPTGRRMVLLPLLDERVFRLRLP